MNPIYNQIGQTYSLGRRTDPHIAAQLHSHLEGASSLLNIGAGTGSYEPKHIPVTAVEPSSTMIKQRLTSSHVTTNVIQGPAESLAVADKSFSHAMTVLSMHHWQDRAKAFSEIKRVTRERFVALTWDPAADPFWLTRDYFPELYQIDQKNFPALSEFEQAFGNISVSALKIPANCIDGFLAAYWQRPEAYLDELVRKNISTFSRLRNCEESLNRLRDDISSGAWEEKNSEILQYEFIDVGYRIVSIDIQKIKG
ncbi:MAG: SAM-dependent methyltransferase [SAR86 cluster bacterium]|uniref:SAM-dependent methyltransferase n=1 Tax=SAR86 cluster bacterium TaxID=2030880 RepID=A0A2A4MLF9_9GAMM|nr:MAG: SAM-dependent methyltransferase [SAR86 cluster bacterium]